MSDFISENKSKIEKLENYIDDNNKKSDLIMILNKTQELFGYIPKEIVTLISEALNIPYSRIYGVVTFYSHFSTVPKGKYIIGVCMGTACFVKGANVILEEFKKELNIDIDEVTEDNLFSLESVRCLGTCGLAPVVSVNGKIYANVKKEDVKDIINEYKGENNE